MREDEHTDPNGYGQRATDIHLRSLERRLDTITHELRDLREWRLGVVAIIDAIPELRSKLEQQERAEAVERGVSEGLRKAEVRGWGSTERRLALLGGFGIVASLCFQAFQAFH